MLRILRPSDLERLCLDGSVVEHALGKGEVAGSIPAPGSKMGSKMAKPAQSAKRSIPSVGSRNFQLQVLNEKDRF